MAKTLDETTLHHIPRRWEGDWVVWSVSNPNELTAVAGHLRYKAQHGTAFFRGETALRGSMLATAFRPHHDGSGNTGVTDFQFDRHAAAMREYIDSLSGSACTCPGGPFAFRETGRCTEKLKRVTGVSSALVSGTYRAVVEPLLQHYGLKTRWIDDVDNIWVALWFACYKQVSEGRYAHHVRRSPATSGADAKAYVIIFQTEQMRPADVPGFSVGTRTMSVDLRYNVPSVYLRPHAQHGALLAPARVGGAPRGSLGESVAGVVEVDLASGFHGSRR